MNEDPMRDVTSDPWNGVRATMRLQFRQGFTLAKAAQYVPYLSRLGISHVYASPLFRSRPGSTHGYDVLDYGCIEPELGGEEGLKTLMAALREHGMGLMIDIVPNHMAVGGAGNPWWEDMLAWGHRSPHASFFDVAWDDPGPETDGRIVMPFLDRPYAQALQEGVLSLICPAESGRFFVQHHEHRFTVCPADYATLLRGSGMPGVLEAALSILAQRDRPDRETEDTLRRLAQWAGSDAGATAVRRCLENYDTGTPVGRNRLHALIEKQAWVLKFWRSGSEILNWRRFFDNTGLGGLCVEKIDVFDATHDYAISLYARGLVDGFRVDHIDGLAAPDAYCARLRARLEGVASQRPPDAPSGAPVYVEKILEPGEALPADWKIDGSTGYDFMDQVSAVLHDGSGQPELDALFATCLDEASAFPAMQRHARREILSGMFPAELARLVRRLARALEETPEGGIGNGHDDTFESVAVVARALLLPFDLYRTYYADERLADHTADREALGRAADQARGQLSPARHELLDRIVACLSVSVEKGPSLVQRRAQRSFEHLTAPLAAKSLEDTLFYRYVRLISRNEVGSKPDCLALSVPVFHERCAQRLETHPDAMLATATHDHKRGEDARMRIAVLSEVAEAWSAQARNWLDRLGDARDAPDRSDALMLLQTLLGVWPLNGDLEGLEDRVSAWFIKALREGKRHTSWLDPDEAYEKSCLEALGALLDPARSRVFQNEMMAFVRQIAPAAALNGLSQTLLRLTVPGVPDLYQGCEFWDFSLVDPDNRRAVDYEQRERVLGEAMDFDMAAACWETGAVKQTLIHALLACRRRHPLLFARGRFEPFAVKDDRHIVFRRVLGEDQLLVIAPRYMAGLHPDPASLSLNGTLSPIALPQDCAGRWESVLRPGRFVTIGAANASLWPLDAAPIECLIRTSGDGCEENTTT